MMDTFNKYIVAVGAGSAGVMIMNPPREKMTKADALLLAAWIVALADPLDEHFHEILHAVRNS